MKRKFRYIAEIILSFMLIFVSYFAWDRIDVEAYEKYITQYTLEDIAVTLDSDFCNLAYISDEYNVNSSILSVNNYQNRVYTADILLELTGVDEDTINNLILVVDNVHYSLNDIQCFEDNNKYYFLIIKVELDEYEKENYNLKLLVEDSYKFSDDVNFSYNIIKEIV